MTENALQAVEAEATTGDESVVVTLTGKNGTADITVPNAMDWDGEATEVLSAGRFYTWAELVLSDDDFEAWRSVRPTNRQIDEFFRSWSELTGQDAGKSRALRRSSKTRSSARR